MSSLFAALKQKKHRSDDEAEKRPRRVVEDHDDGDEDADDQYKLDMKLIREKQRQLTLGNSKWGTFQPGPNIIRIMPPKPPSQLFYHEVPWHYGIGERGVPCSRGFGKACVVCMKSDAWLNEESSRLQKLGDSIKQRTKYLINAVDMGAPDAGVKIYTIPQVVLDALFSILSDSEYGNFSHPRTGFSVKVLRKGKGLGTKYPNITPSPNKGPLKDMGWLKRMHNLSTVYALVEKGELLRMLKDVATKQADDTYEEPRKREGHEESYDDDGADEWEA